MTRRTAIPFALWDSYEPRDINESKQDVRRYSKNFSRPPQVTTSHSINVSFWWLWAHIDWNCAWKLKNDHWLAFSKIKNEWDVIRPSRLLWEIAMDPRMSAKTNDKCGEALENFLGPSKEHRHLPQRALFGAFGVKYALRDHQTQKFTRGSRLRS